jgi:NitT/TauT family transport system ATP-binding protein
VLEISSLRKSYDGHGRQVEALRDITLSVADGEFVCVVGPSGCGKTTLLRCLGGLLTPTSGEVKVAGRPVTGPPDGLAIVFQEYGRSLFPWMRVAENVELPLKSKGLDRSARGRLIAESLAAVGLADAGRAYPWQLSGGMQQRFAIARAIAFQPRVLLMDEPFAALDAITRDVLHEELVRLWEATGLAVLFVTHNVREAVRLGQRVVLMGSRPGRVVREWSVDIAHPRTIESPEVSSLAAAITRHLHEEISRNGH